MHKRRFSQFSWILVLLWVLWGTSIAWAQDARFEVILRRSLAASPDLERQRLAVEIAALDITRARSAFLPRADMTLENNRVKLLGNLSSVELLQLSGNKSGYIVQAGLKLGLNLYNGGQDKAIWDKAEETLRGVQLQWQRRRADVALQVLDRHHAFELTQIDWQISQARAAQAKRRLNEIGEMVYFGYQADFRLTEAELDIQDRQLDLLRRQRERLNAWKDLNAISLLDTGTVNVMSDKSLTDDIPESLPSQTNYLAALLKLDLSGELIVDEIDLARSLGRITEFDQRRARGRYRPAVDFFVKQNQVGVDFNNYDAAFRDLSNDKRYIGVSIRWNFFEGFDTWAEVSQSDLKNKSAHADLVHAQLEREHAVRDRDRMEANAEAELSFERKRLEVIIKRLALERVRFDVGHADSSTVVQVETDLQIQRLEVLRREQTFNYLCARRALLGDFKGKAP